MTQTIFSPLAEERPPVEATAKICARCFMLKSLSEFYRNKRYKDGRFSWCRVCHQDYQKENRDLITQRNREAKTKDPDKFKDKWLRSNYGISLDKFNVMLNDQGGRCAICLTNEPPKRGGNLIGFHIDHDHSCCPGKKSCGKCVRGLLCQHCNQGLGQFRDNTDRLLGALTYLERTRR